MAEVRVGVAASGAGLASLVIQLLQSAQTIREFHGRVKGVPEALLNLSHDLETVSLMLRQLEKHRQHDSYDAELLGGCISQCQRSVTQMESLVRKLESRLSRLRMVGKIMVALQDDEFHLILGDLEQAKSSIMLAFQMYSFSRQTQQYQQDRHELGQLRSAAENANNALPAEIRQLSTSTWIQSPGDIGAGRIVETDELHATEPKSLRKSETSHREGPGPEKAILTKRHNSKHRKKQYHYRINFAWLTGRIWDIAAGQAENGWDIRMSIWNMRPEDSRIFLACRTGDISTVQQLLRNREASQYDCYTESRNASISTRTLLDIAARSGYLELCQFLLTETNLGGAGIAISTLNEYAPLLNAHEKVFGFRIPFWFYTLFIEDSDFDPDVTEAVHAGRDVEKLPVWLSACTAEDCINLIQRKQPMNYFYWSLEQRIELSMGIVECSIASQNPHRLLDWIGLEQVTRELAVYKRFDGCTALHLAAREIAWVMKDGEKPALDLAVNLTVDLISNGADVSATWRGLTPFAVFINCSKDHCCRGHLESNLKDVLELWNIILRTSGVDLHSFANSEQKILESPSRPNVSSGLGEWLQVHRLVFDENTNTWDVKMRTRRSIPIYQMASIPGAWVPYAFKISRICWPPSVAEKEEGTWTEISTVHIQSDLWTLGAEAQDQPQIAFESLFLQTQDDHGAIALRTNKRKHPSMLRRSCSLSHLLGSRVLDQQCYRSGAKTLRPWLPHSHICLGDGRRRFDCGDENMDWNRLARACIRGASVSERCVQETASWQKYHFDGREMRMWKDLQLKGCPTGLGASSFLTEDGRWVSVQNWKTIKACETRPPWHREGCSAITLNMSLEVPGTQASPTRVLSTTPQAQVDLLEAHITSQLYGQEHVMGTLVEKEGDFSKASQRRVASGHSELETNIGVPDGDRTATDQEETYRAEAGPDQIVVSLTEPIEYWERTMPKVVKNSWVCPCGYVVDETFYEYDPGAVVAEITQCPSSQGRDQGSGMQSLRQFVRGFQLAISDRITDLMDITGHICWKRDDEDPDRPRQVRGNNDVEMQPQTNETTKYLFTCVTICGRHVNTRMIPLSIMAAHNDRVLFHRLRKEYSALAGFWRRLLGLKRVSGIRFVQFQETHHPSWAIYQHSEQLGSKEETLPPSIISNAPNRHEWFYSPNPRRFIPPITSERLVHFYNCSESCLDSSYCRDRFPKHIREKPRIEAGEDEVASWGIELIEGRDWAFLWIIGLIVIFLSLLFGILWAILMSDIQGGFTVASYFTGGAACLVGTVQFALDNM